MEKKARDPSPAGQQHEVETLLTTQQAAWLLRISHKTLQRMRVEGRGPKFVKIGRCVRYRQADLLTWISDNTHQSTSEF